MAGSDPFLLKLVLGSLGILLIGVFFTFLRQPAIIGYILAGVLLGPQVLYLITDQAIITTLGNIGVVMLLFFIGMEVDLARLLKSWKVSVYGTLGQILLSVFFSFLLGYFFAWPPGRSLVVGFVISISSTALLTRWLESNGELKTNRGQNILGILLVQDFAIVPMIIIISVLGGAALSPSTVVLQIVGALFLIGLLYVMYKSNKLIKLPFAKKLRQSHDLQMFCSFILCFGLAALTGIFGLSEALGAFIAGLLMNKIDGVKWVHDALHSFKIVFVAIFFVSVGLLIDLSFLAENINIIFLLVLVTLLINTFVNAFILRLLNESWSESLYSGSLLAPIGEFSFVLVATGLASGVITVYGYQMAIIVIALTLFVSSLWTGLFKYVTKVSHPKNSF